MKMQFATGAKKNKRKHLRFDRGSANLPFGADNLKLVIVQFLIISFCGGREIQRVNEKSFGGKTYDWCHSWRYAGSRFEWDNIKAKDFELFDDRKCEPTDDSVMSLAIAKALMNCAPDFTNLKQESVSCMQELGKKYPHAGYGGSFKRWICSSNPQPYNSWGNSSAMRVSACGYAANTIEQAIALSRTVTEVTHNHPEGMKGAESVAVAIFMALHGSSMLEFRARKAAGNRCPCDCHVRSGAESPQESVRSSDSIIGQIVKSNFQRGHSQNSNGDILKIAH